MGCAWCGPLEHSHCQLHGAEPWGRKQPCQVDTVLLTLYDWQRLLKISVGKRDCRSEPSALPGVAYNVPMLQSLLIASSAFLVSSMLVFGRQIYVPSWHCFWWHQTVHWHAAVLESALIVRHFLAMGDLNHVHKARWHLSLPTTENSLKVDSDIQLEDTRLARTQQDVGRCHTMFAEVL